MIKKMKAIKSVYYLNIISSILFLIYLVALLKNLSITPGIFIDEANYANEVISLANFGTDIHGLQNPIYFSSVWGQGQSVLYSLIVVPVIKLFGFSMFNFRIPFAIITLLFIIAIYIISYFSNKNKWLSFFLSTSLITAPWIFISGRWILDCNIAPMTTMFGILVLFLSFYCENKLKKYVLLSISAFLIALSAYGYVVAWLYLPFLLMVTMIHIIKNKLLNLKEILFYGIFMFIIVLPILIFAYNVNVLHTANVTKFLWFDMPPLPANRVSSLIDFNNSNLIKVMIENFFQGIKMYFYGSDNLPWNSTSPHGAIFPWLLIFLVIGILAPRKLFSERAFILKQLIVITVSSFIPLMFIITPNYNHWNFINLSLALLVGFGLYVAIISIERKTIKIILAALPLIMFAQFYLSGYFGIGETKTFFKDSQVQYSEVQKLTNLMNTKYVNKNLFVDGLSGKFVYFRLVSPPIDHQTYLSIQDQKKEYVSENMGPQMKYGYLRNIDMLDSEYKYGDIVLVAKDDNRFNENEWLTLDDLEFDHIPHKLITKRI